MRVNLLEIADRSSLTSPFTSEALNVEHAFAWMCFVKWDGNVTSGTAVVERSVDAQNWVEVKSQAMAGVGGSISFIWTETEPARYLRLRLSFSSPSVPTWTIAFNSKGY